MLVHGDISLEGNHLDAPTVRIDPRLRKALLKALNNLEKESEETTENLFTTTESEELLEESTTSDRVKGAPNVHFTAFTFDGNSTEGDADDNTIYKTIVVPRTTLSPPKETPPVPFNDLDPLKEQDIQIETVQQARSVATSIHANDITGSKISDKVLALSKQALTETTTTTTPSSPTTTTITTTTTTAKPTTTTTTTTTTEAPVTNADGENIEKVDDVQIHQAPLVAAFTVAQDAQGLPKSVVPIFKQIIDPPATAKPTIRAPVQNQIPPFVVNPYQIALEAKQRELEQRIQYLQAQQRQQELIFRQQQQQLFFEQRFRAEEEQRLRQRFEQEQRFRQQQQFPQRAAGVQIVPSVTLSGNNPAINNNNNNGLPVDQQLPVKDAANFRLQNDQQLPFLNAPLNFKPHEQIAAKNIPGPLQLQPQLQLPQRAFIPFNTQVSIVPSVSAQLKNNNIEPGFFQQQPQFEGNPLTRVFRHGAGSPTFEQQQSQQIYVPPQGSAQNLQQLIFHSGLAGRSNEDLNIITRVLALNHGIQAPLTNNFINQQQRV